MDNYWKAVMQLDYFYMTRLNWQLGIMSLYYPLALNNYKCILLYSLS